MNRLQVLVDHSATQALLDAGAERFHWYGYAGCSVADIAGDTGLTRAQFADHFPSKLALLTELALATWAEGVAHVEAAVAQAGTDPGDRLDAAVFAQCEFAVRRRQALRVIESEQHRLSGVDRACVDAATDRLAQILAEIVTDGVLLGVFALDRPAVTAQALAGMCAAAGGWSADSPGETPAQVAETYCELAARMTGAPARSGRHLTVVPALQIA